MIHNSRPLVSIIVPTYGRANHIQRAVDSLLEQTYRPIEIIVVDDNSPGSEDRANTDEALNKYSGCEFLRIILRDENGGGAAARNTGINIAAGALITFLDDDDYYLPDKVELQVAHILQSGLDISLCNMKILEDGRYVDEDICYARGVTLSEFIVGGIAFTPMIMSTSSLLRKVGGFHPTPRFQDHVLMIKLLECNPRVAVLHKKLFVHNRHGDQRITNGRISMLGHGIRMDFERKHVSLLSGRERKTVELRHAIVGSRLERLERGVVAGLTRLVPSIRYIATAGDAAAVIKTGVRLFIKPQTHF